MKKGGFHAAHEKKAILMLGMEKGGFHARHEKKAVIIPGMKKGGFHARIFNGRLCLSQLQRRSGWLKAGGNLDRY